MLGMMMDRPLLISSILEHAVRSDAQRTIVARDTDGTLWRYSYREMATRARRLANALLARGIARGDRVATLAWNDHRHLEMYYAVPGIGAVLHTCNPRLHVDQLAYVLNHAEDTVLMFDPAFAQLVEAVVPRCPKLRHVVCLSHALPSIDVPHVESYEAWIASSDDRLAWPEFDERTASGLCYTSGTTGHPKGVLYSHRSTVLHSLVLGGNQALAVSPSDTVMPVVPMFHVNAWGLPYGALLNGAALVLPGARLDAASLFELIDAEHVTCAAGVPTIWLALAQYMQQHGVRPATMRRTVVGGSAMPAALIRTFAESFDVEVRHAWGMTETSPLGTVTRALDPVDDLDDLDEHALDARYARAATQGHPVFGVELALRTSDGGRAPHDGQTCGELLVRGPWIASGYVASGTCATEDGWFATGDVATIDASGCMRITDRVKDVIKSGGEWISSIDLENAVMAHPAALMAAVIGVPHPKWDERPHLFVVSRPGSDVDAATLHAFLAQRVAKWWLPETIEFVAELPLGATGKVQKQTLREIWAARARSVEASRAASREANAGRIADAPAS
ncbi:long-chain-fatty-acid--CoA ligase [Pararobbsia silviterrae]|uniref:Long-chain-fatty-acid--CoA ligase n=1 Tax=Pararobbsia silviterrae TaxID=1792498 RepID=A0A494Y1E9_9BURK|nr:long-chain-fatty-acid--CoA ligase [Pararobbsia silviterrae]RKP56595.1 long-chain-fatty-acid--CoA ligase [Pararobbsia silviterrae]